jgi:hypothetical protein
MHKLRLTLEDLQIDSFSTTPVKKEKGTVYGEQCTCPTACTCPGCPTCDASCNGTCGGTCDASCNGTCGDTCNCGTYDYSCDGNTCVPGCPTFVTQASPMHFCMDCAG